MSAVGQLSGCVTHNAHPSFIFLFFISTRNTNSKIYPTQEIEEKARLKEEEGMGGLGAGMLLRERGVGVGGGGGGQVTVSALMLPLLILRHWDLRMR
jgi:hypothetical protein